jgi:predicted TPR repeat methyltransferase
MHYGRLYDEQVADSYDEDALGLLAGVRSLGVAQIFEARVADDAVVLDLGVGTGATLSALAPRIPNARMIGIDLSVRMIEIAQRKLPFEAHVDDACNAGARVPAASVDLVLAHFLTSFVDRPSLFGAARGTLKAGGLFSVVSTPHAAFKNVRQIVGALLGEAAVNAAAPAPTVDELTAEVQGAGFEILASNSFQRAVEFQSFDEAVEWGMKSGFFAQGIDAIGLDTIRQFADTPGVFPLADEYVGVALLARAI